MLVDAASRDTRGAQRPVAASGNYIPPAPVIPQITGEATMSMVDPWEKAADCERSAQAAIDPHRRAMLQKLRDLWVSLANRWNLMSEAEAAAAVEAINRRHIRLLPASGGAKAA